MHVSWTDTKWLAPLARQTLRLLSSCLTTMRNPYICSVMDPMMQSLSLGPHGSDAPEW